MDALPTVVVIPTGGTIASRPDPVTGGVAPALTGEQLVQGVPGVASVAEIEVAPFPKSVLGPALTPVDLFSLARQAVALLERPEVSGVVVTAGTGIIEEGSYLCELLNPTSKPIVWTGAQFSSDMWDTDGPRNLLNAIRVAASPEWQDLGSVVVFNQEVMAARDVVKLHKTNVSTFTALDLGILGRADEDRVVLYRRPALRRWYTVDRIETNVDLIKLVSGTDDRFFLASLAAGARGIVVEAFPGVGIINPEALPGIKKALAAGVPVVLATRSPEGRTIPKYGAEIGARDLVQLGVLLAGDLAATKVRMLLMVLLGRTQDVDELRRYLVDAAP